MKKLYAVYLGGRIKEENFIEDHEIVFVVAEDEKEARSLGREKWNAMDIHVDGTKLVENIDGFSISLSENNEQDKIIDNNEYSK